MQHDIYQSDYHDGQNINKSNWLLVTWWRDGIRKIP